MIPEWYVERFAGHERRQLTQIAWDLADGHGLVVLHPLSDWQLK